MPSLNFTVFVDKVADGSKPHTIRAWRKVPFKRGDDLSFFTGMRTKKCRRLRKNERCTCTMPIYINSGRRMVTLFAAKGSHYARRLRIDGRLNAAEIRKLARLDGFESVDAFFEYFAQPYNGWFNGQLVEWMP